jgi:hypothetical protein
MATGDDPGPGDPEGPLAFLLGRDALVRRFLLAELIAPPLSMRRRARGKDAPGAPPHEATKPGAPRGERR